MTNGVVTLSPLPDNGDTVLLLLLLLRLDVDNVDLLDLDERLDSEPDRDADFDLADLAVRLVFHE